MKSAWRVLAAVGVVGMIGAAPGCVVGSGSDEDGGTSGGGGVTNGGSGGVTGGGSGGVTGGGTGGVVTGGTGGATGGSGGGGAGWDCNADPATSTAGSCEPAEPNNQCLDCIKQNCCTEMANCFGTNPNNACGVGLRSGSTDAEFLCFQKCLTTQTQGGASLSEANNTCGAQCVSTGCGTISPETSDLFACVESSCLSECI